MATIHETIEFDRAQAMGGAPDVKEFRDYYEGRQRSTVSRDQGRILRGVLGHLFCHNVCRKIVNEVAGRCQLLRFRVEDEGVAAFLDELWIKNRLAALQTAVTVATVRDGNHALALNWHASDPYDAGNGRVTVHPERWWDGTQGIFVHYEAGIPAYAVKEWEQRDADGARVWRRTVWRPDRIERYRKEGDGWRPNPLDGEPDDGVVPWRKRDGSPLGIPVVHFANGRLDDSEYGPSDLDGGVLGIQDEINDIQRDITATARLTGYQMYWATGVQPEKDASGRNKPLAVGPGQTLQNDNPNARYGVLPAGDLTQLKGALVTKIEAVSEMTDTPRHTITGEWPAGVALLRAEMPLVAKASRLIDSLTPSWGTVAHRATEMQNTFGDGDQLDEDALITAEFAPPERLDALTQAQVAEARLRLGTDRQALREVGFTEQEIDGIVRDREAAGQDAAFSFERAFNAGAGA